MYYRFFIIFILSITTKIHAYHAPNLVPSSPKLTASSYLLIDYDSDRIIAEHNQDQQVEPASLTKIMTMYVVEHEIKNGNLKLDDKVRVSNKAWKMGGSRMFLENNSLVPVSELIKGIIVQSGNDASIAIAEHIAGTENAFVDLMNAYAEMLGMKDTNFMNSTGWPQAGHYTTAKDMGILAKAVIKHFPQSYKIYSEKTFVHNKIKQNNRNRLLWRNPNVDGIKTGHTNAAGFCIVASGKKQNMRLIAIVMGTKDDRTRTDEANKLLNWGFRFYETHKKHSAGEALSQARVWLGNKQTLDVGLNSDLHVTVPRGQYKKIKSEIEMEKDLKAPIKIGEKIGTIKLSLNQQIIKEEPIIALDEIRTGNLTSRAFDYAKLVLKKFIPTGEELSSKQTVKK